MIPLRIEPLSQMDGLSFNYANEPLPMQNCQAKFHGLKSFALNKWGGREKKKKTRGFLFRLY